MDMTDDELIQLVFSFGEPDANESKVSYDLARRLQKANERIKELAQ